LARKSTFAYRCRKYVKRHKVGVAAAALVLLSLLTGIVLTWREARIARANELRAEQRFNDVRKLANSLLFDLHDAIQDLPGSTPARKMVVEKALQYLDSLTADAGTDTGLARELATAYERVGELQGQPLASNLGNTSNALTSHQKGLRIRQQLGERLNAEWQDRLSLAASYRRVAMDLMGIGNTRDALADIHKATAITELMSNANPKDLNVLHELGYEYDVLGTMQGNMWSYASLGDLDNSLESYKRALAAQKRILDIDPSNTSARQARQGIAAEPLPSTTRSACFTIELAT
jgi:tetratricopeptide (TPR) repeat protein